MSSELPNRLRPRTERFRRKYIFRWSICFSKRAERLFVGRFLLHGSVLVTYWKTGEILLILYCTIGDLCRRGACDDRTARAFFVRARVGHDVRKSRDDGNIATGGSGRIRRADGDLVLHRLYPDLRSVCPTRQLFDDDRLCRGHLRTELCQLPVCDRANLCTWAPMTRPLLYFTEIRIIGFLPVCSSRPSSG